MNNHMIASIVCFEQNMYGRTLLFRCLFGVVALQCFAESYENLALNKPTWQQHPFNNVNYSANRAVDGRRSNLCLLGGECAVSLNGYKTTEWRVDLEGVFYIHHIVIHHATGNVDWGVNNTMTQFFLGFSLYISNTTNKEDGVLCFRDSNYTRVTIPNPVKINCPYHGRYVIYYNDRTHPPYPDAYSVQPQLALCEVEVNGCSTEISYGEGNCLPCPPNCLRGLCKKGEGTCFGCIDGYIGPMCHEECSNGMFGHECGELCGVCAGRESCHHTNGTCLNGCDDGYIGPNCIKVQQSEMPENKRKYPLLFIGVLTAAVILVITAFVFIITSKRYKAISCIN